MNRVVDAARICLYAAVGCEVVRSPDIARTIALVAPERAFAATLPGSAASLGWLTGAIATALAHVFGFAGLALGTALALFGTLALVEWRARRVSSPAIALAAAALVAVSSLEAAHIGGGAENGLCLAALFVALDLGGTGGLIAIALVTMLWCNVSAAGIFAPVFALAYALGTMADRGAREERVRTQTAVLVSLIATLATPAFIAFPMLAWRATGIDSAFGDVLPSAPYLVAPLGYQIGVVLTIVVALAAGARAPRTGATFAVAAAAYLAFGNGAFVPFLAIASAPVLAESAARLFAFARTAADAPPKFAVGALSIVAVAACVTLSAYKFLPPLSTVSSTPPFGALAKFSQLPEPRGRLFCTKLAWCDVAERSYGIDVVADTRIAVAPGATATIQRDISKAKKDWDAKARAAGIAAMFIDSHSGFATLLTADGWKPYATDGTGVLFVRAGGAQ